MKKFFSPTNIILILLMCLSSLIIFFQSQSIWTIIDHTYQLENAYRIYIGQVPYKDFFLVVAPGTYILMAVLMKLFGLSNIVQIVSTMILGAFTLLFSYNVIKKVTNNDYVSLILSAALVFCGYSIVPIPNYDINAMFFMLVSVNFLIFTLKKKHTFNFLLTGVLLALPPFFKQNTGLVFLLMSIIALFYITIIDKKTLNIKDFLKILIGIFLVFLTFYLWLILFSKTSEFMYQTFIYPGKSRPIVKSLKLIIKSFLEPNKLFLYLSGITSILILINRRLPDKIKEFTLTTLLLITMILIPCCISRKPFTELDYAYGIWYVITICLGYIFIINFLRKLEENKLFLFLPIILIPVSYASFLSQGILGSTYGIWPIFFIMVALIFRFLKHNFPKTSWVFFISALTISISIFLIVALLKNTRLSYVSNKGNIQRATRKHFELITTHGVWIGEMENFFNYVDKNIPIGESIVAIPGEDSLYFATRRSPQLNYFQLNPTTCPDSQDKIYANIRRNKIKWVVIKTNLQMPNGFIPTDNIQRNIRRDYSFVDKIDGYEIYKRKNS